MNPIMREGFAPHNGELPGGELGGLGSRSGPEHKVKFVGRYFLGDFP